HHRHRGQGLRAAEGPHRTLPRRRVRHRLPAQDQAGDRHPRRPGRARGGDHHAGRAHRQDRRRQDLRHPARPGGAHPHRRGGRRRALSLHRGRIGRIAPACRLPGEASGPCRRGGIPATLRLSRPPTRPMTLPRSNTPHRVLFASLIGTTIEFFDFYIYATAAVLVFPSLFFPSGDPVSATLQSFATFALAFFARPVGSALFGHFGDRIGRKATLVAALLTMGLSTVAIGLLPTYAQIGVVAPALLALCRFGQGLGLGGEWGGAVLLAVENAPPHRRAWYGMFPQLGAPLGFLLANGSFLLLAAALDPAQFMAWGWRVPFIASAILVVLGLWVRLSLHETPAFAEAM